MNNNPQNKTLLIGFLTSLMLIIIGLLGTLIFLMLKNQTNPVPPIPEPTISPTPDIKWQDYQSDRYNFKFEYPQDWKRESIPKNALRPWQLKLYLPGEKEEEIMVIFVEELEELDDLYSLQEYWDDIINPRLKNDLKEDPFELENPTLMNLKANRDKPEHSAYKIHYNYDLNHDTMHAMQVITVYNKRGYHILFKGNKNDYEQYKPMADKLIESWEFTMP